MKDVFISHPNIFFKQEETGYINMNRIQGGENKDV